MIFLSLNSFSQNLDSLEMERDLMLDNGYYAVLTSTIIYGMASTNYIGGIDDYGKSNAVMLGSVGIGINLIAVRYFIGAYILNKKIKNGKKDL